MGDLEMLSRDRVLSQTAVIVERVDVPEWGGFVYVRVISGKTRDAFEFRIASEGAASKKAKKEYNPPNIRARLVSLTACDEKGQLLFSEEDIQKLGELSCAALDRVFSKASEINALSKKDVEDLTKNSDAAQP